MDLRQLKHFLAAAETGNFSKAAEREFVSQPALSASIAKLELDLGAMLFLRSKRGVSLTNEGQRLAETARVVVHECARARNELRGQKTRETVRIAIVDTIAVPLIANFVEAVRVRRPQISIDIWDGPLSYVERLQREKRIDVALKARPSALRSKSSDDGAVDLLDESFVLLAPPNHPLRSRRNVTISDLEGERFIARMHCEIAPVLSKLLKKGGTKLRVVSRTHQDERAVGLVQSGIGVAIAPAHIQVSTAAKIPLSEPDIVRTLRLETAKGTQSSSISHIVGLARSASWRN